MSASGMKDRGFGRRTFLAGSAAFGLAAAGTAAGSALLPGAARAAGPRKGGRFRYAVVGCATTDTLDPAKLADIGPGMMSWQMRRNLLEIGPRTQLRPELAESWEPADGGKRWIFKIRQGVEFHNGKTLTVEDVIFSINHHRGPDSKSSAKPLVDPIAEMKADGKDGLIVTLNEPNADFPYVLVDYHLQIVPADTKDFADGMGTGPYILDKFEAGVRCTGKRNPNYWKEGHGNFDEVECLSVTDSNARIQAMQSGDLDAIMFLDLKVANRFAKSPGMKVVEVAGGTHMTLPMMTNVSHFDDNDVRLALKYAIDREHLVKTALQGHGRVANDQPLSPLNPYFDADLPQRTYDPDKAKFHLKKAGRDGLSVQLWASAAILGFGVDVATLYRQYAEKAGIDIEVVQAPATGYWTDVWEKKPWCESYFGARPTADGMFSIVYATGAPWNETFFSNARVDTLLKEARQELDQAKRKAMYGEVQQIISDEGGSVIPFFMNAVDGATDKVGTGDVASDFNLDGGRAADRWWFES
jgi:peptide/nickel transport system substrate-binding protein